MKNKSIFSFSDAFDPPASLCVVHSSLAEFSSGTSREVEFPSFPSKLGVVTRFRETRQGYVATIDCEWPSLTSTTRGELVLCQEAEENTQKKTLELIERCRSLARELNSHADRLRAQMSQRMLHTSNVNASSYAKSLEDSGKLCVWEIDACERQERKGPREARERREVGKSRATHQRDSKTPRASPTRASSSRLDPNALSAILADEDTDDDMDDAGD